MSIRTYINESHRKYVEACEKEIEEMAKHPLSNEEFIAQSIRNREAAIKMMSRED